MTKKREVYHCAICGNIVEVVHEGAVLSCCGKPMQLLAEHSTDGAYERHVPVVEVRRGDVRVSVGSVDHPMTTDHHIQWIELLAPSYVARCELLPGDKPEATFCLAPYSHNATERGISVRAYCNMHGLWQCSLE